MEALGCISSRSTDPPRPQSISLEEISRWQEVEAEYLPPGAVAKPAAPAVAAADASAAAAAPVPAESAVATKVEGATEGTLDDSAAAASPPVSDVPRVKCEPEAGAADVPAPTAAEAAAAGPVAAAVPAPAAAIAASSTSPAGLDGVKSEGGESRAAAATTTADEVDPEEAKYHELFLETLRKGRLKGQSGPGDGGSGEGKGKASNEDEVEEEEVLLYSDHEEEEEEAAQAAEAAAGTGEGAASGQGKKDDDNEQQAKEQLANLSYFDLVKVNSRASTMGSDERL